MEDIVPGLLKKIEEDFQKQFDNDSTIAELAKKLEQGTATHSEAYTYAGKVGACLSNAYKKNISKDVLPDGKIWYNIANRVITPTMIKNYEVIEKYVSDVQTQLNKAAGIGIKAIKPVMNQDRIRGIINRISSEDDYDSVSWVLHAPVETAAKSVVDDSIKANAEFHGKSGLRPKIIRKTSGKCCKWCNEVAGIYYYPDIPKDVYRRHNNCDCVVEYDPGDGKRQNVHTKQWQTQEEREKKEYRKTLGQTKQMKGKDVTKQYISNSTPGKGKIVYGEGYNEKQHKDEIRGAELLHKIFGGDIVLLSEVNADKVMTADYLWNGKYWDLKSTSTSKSANSAIRHGLKQIRENPGGIILNYNDNNVDIDEVIEVIEKRMEWSKLGQVDIMIIRNKKVVVVLRYK